jgi:hypothetical protein
VSSWGGFSEDVLQILFINRKRHTFSRLKFENYEVKLQHYTVQKYFFFLLNRSRRPNLEDNKEDPIGKIMARIQEERNARTEATADLSTKAEARSDLTTKAEAVSGLNSNTRHINAIILCPVQAIIQI